MRIWLRPILYLHWYSRSLTRIPLTQELCIIFYSRSSGDVLVGVGANGWGYRVRPHVEL